MKLADTHTVLWLTHEQHHLSARALAALEEARREGGVAVSDISLWEIAMLTSKGRITIPRPLDEYLRHVESTFVVLPVTSLIAERSIRFSAGYPSDPADKIIGATAVAMALSLVTKDEAIRRSGEVECVW